jgi:hypothetical protein
MTWVHVLWSGYIVTWMTATESSLTVAAAWWLAGLTCIALLRAKYPSALSGSAPSSATAPDDEPLPPERTDT